MTITTKYNLDDTVFFLDGVAALKGIISGFTITYSKEETIIKYNITTTKGFQIREESLLVKDITELISKM